MCLFFLPGASNILLASFKRPAIALLEEIKPHRDIILREFVAKLSRYKFF